MNSEKEEMWDVGGIRKSLPILRPLQVEEQANQGGQHLARVLADGIFGLHLNTRFVNKLTYFRVSGMNRLLAEGNHSRNLRIHCAI